MAPLNVWELDRDSWLRNCFPQWGTYLNEEIEETTVPAGKLKMWWLGCTGVWMKTENGTDLAVDFWAQRGGHSKKTLPAEERAGQQLTRMTGSVLRPTFLRVSPQVIDPFAVNKLDAHLSTHIHRDHLCPYTAAAAAKNTNAVFIGPKMSGDTWAEWGVPESRIVRMKPGDSYKLNDIEILAVESFDRTALITPPPEGDLRGKMPPDMDERAINYVIKTPGGTVYHSGDSHYCNYFSKHGKDHDIDVCFVSWGENGPGITDKVNSVDTLRVAWSLGAKVLIPIHWDLWACQQPDPAELKWLYNHNKHLYDFNLFMWKIGGMFTYPDDAAKGQYQYPKSEERFFEVEPNIPFLSFL